MSSQVSASCSTHSCCTPPPSLGSRYDTFMCILEKVSLVALTALALYLSPSFFVPAFLLGTGLGVYKYIQEGTSSLSTRLAPSCTQGVLEQITGIKLPVPLALVTNVAITACHTLHHATIFVPIVALFSGMYVGNIGAGYYQSLPTRIYQILPRPTSCQ